MPTFRTLLRPLALACGFMLTLPLYDATLAAQGRPGAPAGRVADRRGDPGAMLLRGITLTPDQQRQVDAWKAARRAERDSMVAAMRAQRQGSAPRTRPDSAAMVARRAELRARMQAEHQQLRAILTPDQQRTFDANTKELAMRAHERMRGGRGAWGRRGPRMPVPPADTTAR